jgi:tetratricopeptide (TPR) repeat protein
MGKGMEAMASPSAIARFNQLWQIPLLLVSVGLFAYAAYLFIDPKPGLTIDQKIEIAQTYVTNDRPEAALEKLNQLLNTEKLEKPNEARIHLLIAEALEVGQKQKKLNIPANHQRIVEQTQIAMSQGAAPTADVHRRMAESYEALDKPSDALEHYRLAMSMDAAMSIHLQKKVIELQLAQNDPGPAAATIEQYLKNEQITDSERAWALGGKAQLMIDRGAFLEARSLLGEALRLDVDPVGQGEINYRLGYCAWKLGEIDQAERHLRLARDLLRVRHPLDGDACYVLGKIYQGKDEPDAAISFYQEVLVSHPDSAVAPLAQLGRGVCRIMLGEDEPGLHDMQELVNAINQRASRAKYKTDALEGLKEAAIILSNRENYQGALELMAHEQSLLAEPPASFFGRLATVYENRAEQIERSLSDLSAAEQIRRVQQVRELRTRAGDAYVGYSRALTLVDDKGYGEAMWKGIDLYDRAADTQQVISALELFVAERPEDPLAPDALLRLGRAYQAAGMFDKAIAAFQRNQFRYPNSLAASKSAVPLAQAYIAKGPEAYGKAETVLFGVVENNPLLTPEAEEFREALFELAQLYYRTGRYEESVARLEELTERYPKDDRMGQLIFLMGDSYRKSASLLDIRLVSTDPTDAAASAAEIAEMAAAKNERLSKARELYDRAIEMYRTSAPSGDLDKLYQKLSHFYRADCVYDLGQYEEAIRLYDTAAFRYQDDPSALAAYVQIVNANCALNKIEEARTANERAKWLLRRMPPEAFADGTFAMPKNYWEQWLKWTGDSGMW